jgi:hypothetical protein
MVHWEEHGESVMFEPERKSSRWIFTGQDRTGQDELATLYR